MTGSKRPEEADNYDQLARKIAYVDISRQCDPGHKTSDELD
jgi:hypothetical protein